MADDPASRSPGTASMANLTAKECGKFIEESLSGWKLLGFKWTYWLPDEDIDDLIDTVGLPLVGRKEDLKDDLAVVTHAYFTKIRCIRHDKSIRRQQNTIIKFLKLLDSLVKLIQSEKDTVHSCLLAAIIGPQMPILNIEKFLEYHELADKEVCGYLDNIDYLSELAQSSFVILVKREMQAGSSDETEAPESQLFSEDLYRVYGTYFRSQGKLSRRPKDGAPAGPYFRFAYAFAEKAGIRQADGKPYAKETIAAFINARPRRRRQDGRSSGGSGGDDMGHDKRK